jgi:hypothetical protein
LYPLARESVKAFGGDGFGKGLQEAAAKAFDESLTQFTVNSKGSKIA